jgi:hypothetical protein
MYRDGAKEKWIFSWGRLVLSSATWNALLPRYKHKRNHDKTGMLLYAGECFVLEVCGTKSDDDDERIVWVICSSFCDFPFLVFRVDKFDFILH